MGYLKYGFKRKDRDGTGFGYGFGFLLGSGHGFGKGYGDGFRSGVGYGYGYNYGDGCGNGNGYGHEYGNKDGSGHGVGNRYGYGYGYILDHRLGIGYGHGSANKTEYWTTVLNTFIKHKDPNKTYAFWRSDEKGHPCNGGVGKAVKVGDVQIVDESRFKPCTEYALHGTLDPTKWNGARVWIVALSGRVEQVDEAKIAATRREIICEIKL